MDSTEQVLDLPLNTSTRISLSIESQSLSDREPAQDIHSLAHRVQHQSVEKEGTVLNLSIKYPHSGASGQKEDILNQLL